MSEWQAKQNKLAEFMANQEIEVMLLSNWRNFAWLTAGKQNQVGVLSDLGAASILITPEGKFIITNSIEYPRLRDEEDLLAQGFQFQVLPWYEAFAGKSPLPDLVKGRTLYSDIAMNGAIDIGTIVSQLRWVLFPAEIERFEKLGADTTHALENAARRVLPGMTEYEISALISHEARQKNIIPFVNLVATDDRIARYRHPLPSAKKLERQAMLVLGGRRGGLDASVTRTIYFGKMPAGLRQRQNSCLLIEATFITATKVGVALQEILTAGVAKYTELGWPDEWRRHHQGGLTGYNGRELFATPEAKTIVAENQAFAWNPSVDGTKSEDVFVVKSHGRSWITGATDWPTVEISLNGETMARPTIWEIN